MTKGFVYILECSDGSYYTGSTIDLEKRIAQHQNGLGSNHTKKRLPINLVYVEEFQRIDDAFYREKQIQGWSRKKKEALIENNQDKLPKLSECKNETHFGNVVSTPLNHQESTPLNHQESTPLNHQELTPVAERCSLSRVEVSRSYHSNGKLLLTAEYVVLDGALSLAIPTKYGQSLTVEHIDNPIIFWESFDEKGETWFKGQFEIQKGGKLNAVTNDETSKRLLQILNATKGLNPKFLSSENGFKIETHLDFPKDWGLGTSSTLINNIAQWANVDAFKLLELTFGGSGYDIACAQHNTPVTYQLLNTEETLKHNSTSLNAKVHGDKRIVEKVDFSPSFKNNLYFVYLNKKQNSREGIAHYKSIKTDLKPVISEISDITLHMISCKDLTEFQNLIKQHECIISKLTKQLTVKSLFFEDFDGSIKSLGAWGGDFVLVCSETDPTSYFNEKGFETIIPYKNMMKSS